VGLLLALATGGCRPVAAPDTSQPNLAKLDRLLRLMEQRLLLMHDVARWKWSAGKSILDAQRERELLRSVVEQGRDSGLEPQLVRSFFAAQMEAARLVQQADFERWKTKKEKPTASKDLAVLRRRIDELNRELIDALAEVGPCLSEQRVQEALPERAEEILSGNELDEVRDTAISALRR
jgi:chorismate mutase